jgi:diaminopimelate decarboxylase
VDLSSLLPDTCRLESTGTWLGDWSIASLAQTFGTPLYLYDAVTLREEARRTRAAFAPVDARVSFAAKACSTIGVLHILQRAGLDLDAVSEGEMVAALRAGFEPARIHLHGNCKSDHELELAVRYCIRSIVADSADELLRIASVCHRLGRTAGVSLRLSIELDVDTHPYLRTSGLASKFGIRPGSTDECRAIETLTSESVLDFCGIHCHAGSQISDPGLYARLGAGLIEAANSLQSGGLDVREVSIGGGWAVPYTPGASRLLPEDVATAVMQPFAGLPAVRLAVEPGRALVARAGIAVYTVGSVKEGPKGRLVAVDGGMADNPRPSLYGATYTAFCANRPLDEPVGRADIVGRYCEGGDVLTTGTPLPEMHPGDLICVPVSGAYQLSMASNYNLVPRPAAVMVDGRDTRLMTQRETVAGMLSRERDSGDSFGA